MRPHTLLLICLSLLALPLFAQAKAAADSTGATTPQPPIRLSSSDGSISAKLDKLSGDNYFAKVSNSGVYAYKVYYRITDGGKVVQDETSIVVWGHSSNSDGPYHCSSTATITITKTEKIFR